jgi:hypothetical protein
VEVHGEANGNFNLANPPFGADPEARFFSIFKTEPFFESPLLTQPLAEPPMKPLSLVEERRLRFPFRNFL